MNPEYLKKYQNESWEGLNPAECFWRAETIVNHYEGWFTNKLQEILGVLAFRDWTTDYCDTSLELFYMPKDFEWTQEQVDAVKALGFPLIYCNYGSEKNYGDYSPKVKK